MLAMVLSLVILGVLGGGVWYGVGKVRGFFTAPDYTGSGTGAATVEVVQGDTATSIGQTLQEADVVKSAKAFIRAAQGNARSKSIEPGFYKLRKQMSATVALDMLLDKANKVLSKVTVPEGLTSKETFALVAKATNIAVAEFEAAAKDPVALGVPDFWFNRDDGRPATKSVEGFLFPATYEFDPGVTATDILKKMIGLFLEVAGSVKLVDTAQAKDTMPFEALIIASLVEAEAGVAADMPKVSRVVYNRLNRKPTPMMLEFDSTTNYWRELHGQPRKDNLNDAELLDPANPYRTYGLAGLPPGPIGNPGKAALLAAINPTPDANWIYFVKIDKAGNSKFTDNYAQHQRNITEAKANGAF